MRLILIMLLLIIPATSFAGINEWTYVGLAPEDITAIAVHPTDPNIIYASALDVYWDSTREGGLFKTVDGGLTWDTLGFRHQNVMDVAIDPSDPEMVWIVAQDYGAWCSLDAGVTWEMRSEGMYLTSFERTGPRAIAICPQDPDRLIAGSGAYDGWGEAYFSEDGGSSWHSVLTGTALAFAKFDPQIPGLCWFGIDLMIEAVWMSTDTGRTLTRVNATSHHGGVSDLRVSAVAPGAMWYVAGGHITVTADTGQTWEEVPFFTEYYDSVVTKAVPLGLGDTLVVDTYHDPYITADRGLHWQRLGTDTLARTTQNLWPLQSDSLTYWSARSNLGIWACTVIDTSTGLSPRPRLPNRYRMEAYPNPAHSYIMLTVPHLSGTEHLLIFDVLGREVAYLRPDASTGSRCRYVLPPSLSTGHYFLQIRAAVSTNSKPLTIPITIMR